jgi:hypothetical protein
MPKKYTSSFTLSCSIAANVCTDTTTGASNESISACNVSVNYTAPTYTISVSPYYKKTNNNYAIQENSSVTVIIRFNQDVVINTSGYSKVSNSVYTKTVTMGVKGTSISISAITTAYSESTGMYVINGSAITLYACVVFNYITWYEYYGDARFTFGVHNKSTQQYFIPGWRGFVGPGTTSFGHEFGGDSWTRITSTATSDSITFTIRHVDGCAGECGCISCEFNIHIYNSIFGFIETIQGRIDHGLDVTYHYNSSYAIHNFT